MVVPVLFCTDRGEAGYRKNTRDFNELIWRHASPKWNFDEATFDRTAASFNKPDHGAIVMHNYRCGQNLAKGEPKCNDLEMKLAEGPVISVPTITLEGDANGASHTDPARFPTPGNSPADMRTER